MLTHRKANKNDEDKNVRCIFVTLFLKKLWHEEQKH